MLNKMMMIIINVIWKWDLKDTSCFSGLIEYSLRKSYQQRRYSTVEKIGRPKHFYLELLLAMFLANGNNLLQITYVCQQRLTFLLANIKP